MMSFTFLKVQDDDEIQEMREEDESMKSFVIDKVIKILKPLWAFMRFLSSVQYARLNDVFLRFCHLLFFIWNFAC